MPVRELAEAEGLTIALRQGLGNLRGRLVGDTIELVKDDHPVVQRFTIAHELGHRALRHTHGDGAWAETEADQYANELLVPGPMLTQAMKTTTSATASRLARCATSPPASRATINRLATVATNAQLGPNAVAPHRWHPLLLSMQAAARYRRLVR